MALPDILRGTYISILLGNGATPEVFSPLCGITTRTFRHQGNTTDAFVRDCAVPDSVPVRRLMITGEQWDLSGNGQLNRSQLAAVTAAGLVRKNYRFVIGQPADNLVFGGYFAGPAILTMTEIGGGDNEFATISLTIGSDGVWAWTDV